MASLRLFPKQTRITEARSNILDFMFYDRTMGIHSIFYLSLYLSTLTPTHIHTHARTNAHAHMHAHTQRYTLMGKEGKRGFTSTVNCPDYSERRPRQESRCLHCPFCVLWHGQHILSRGKHSRFYSYTVSITTDLTL